MPNPSPETDRTKAKSHGYRVVSVSLYTLEADWIDEIAELLRRFGNPKVNRSLVVREAILRLQEELIAKNPSEVLRDFNERHAKRSEMGAHSGEINPGCHILN